MFLILGSVSLAIFIVVTIKIGQGHLCLPGAKVLREEEMKTEEGLPGDVGIMVF